MKLTQEQIEEIRKRAEAATPDEWFVMHDRDVMIESPSGSCDTHTIAYSETNVDATFITNARQDIPALLAHIAELENKCKEFSEKGKRVTENRNMWRELRMEAGGRLGEVIPKMSKYEEALQKIVDGEADSLGDAFRIAKEALDNAES